MIIKLLILDAKPDLVVTLLFFVTLLVISLCRDPNRSYSVFFYNAAPSLERRRVLIGPAARRGRGLDAAFIFSSGL